MGFDPLNFSLKIWESIGTPTPKVGGHLGMWKFIPSHSPTLPGAWNVTPRLHFWPAASQALALVESPKVGLIHNNWHFFWQKSQLLLPLPHFSKVFSFVNMLIYILLQNQHVSKVFTFLFVAFLTWNPTLVFHLFGWPTWPIFLASMWARGGTWS